MKYTSKQGKYCKNVSKLDKNGNVYYAGGIMHNSCWYCGTSFGSQHCLKLLKN